MVCSIRRRFSRGLPKKYAVLLKKLRKAKKECPMHEKPAVVKTHLRNMIIMPEMIGSVVGVYNGKTYVSVEIKAEMVGTKEKNILTKLREYIEANRQREKSKETQKEVQRFLESRVVLDDRQGGSRDNSQDGEEEADMVFDLKSKVSSRIQILANDA